MGRRSSEGKKRPTVAEGESSSSKNLMYKSDDRGSWEPDFAEAAQHARDCIQGNPHCGQRLTDPLCRYLDSLPASGLHPEFRREIDLTKRRVYHRRENEDKSTLHWGQRKLLLAELEFLMAYGSNAAALVVYVGAGPGDHIPVLIRLINAYRHYHGRQPLSFELFDTTPFAEPLRRMAAEDPGSLRLIQEKFDIDRARSSRYRDSSTPVLLISDIRSGNWQGQTFDENEKMVMADMSAQLAWWKAMKPQKALMKFRLPYTEGKVSYASGRVNYPIWGAQTTTEARLTIDTPDAPIIEYDNEKFGEAMAYFNTVLRTAVYERPSNLKGPDEPLLEAGLCRCYDCTAEVRILSAYLEGCGADGSSTHTVADFSTQISDQMGPRTLLTCSRSPAEKGTPEVGKGSPKRRKVVEEEDVQDEDPTLALMRSMGLPTGFVGDKQAQYEEDESSGEDSSGDDAESDEPWRRSTGGSRHREKRERPAVSRVLQEKRPADSADMNASSGPMQTSGSHRKSSECPQPGERPAPPAEASPSTTAAECTPRKSPSTSSSSEPLTPGTILLREYTRHFSFNPGLLDHSTYWSDSSLANLCQKLRLPATGSREEIIGRLRTWHATHNPNGPTPGVPSYRAASGNFCLIAVKEGLVAEKFKSPFKRKAGASKPILRKVSSYSPNSFTTADSLLPVVESPKAVNRPEGGRLSPCKERRRSICPPLNVTDSEGESANDERSVVPRHDQKLDQATPAKPSRAGVAASEGSTKRKRRRVQFSPFNEVQLMSPRRLVPSLSRKRLMFEAVPEEDPFAETSHIPIEECQ
ncbi:hypothetical protein FOZ62_028116 [Perkinsus olseni]|uniref:Cap-specific mRNA (nucleoside-2'-O-)-methyltransferase n=3 Tax=Perkinsus olseni TaxID=32597 RepID=A0A7J6T083_PEROL|nr:hypothetical protein FOZ62_028116 [Perkinsus olseni]